jgi:hypothetical protein
MKKLLLFTGMVLSASLLSAQLTAGNLAFVGYSADSSDGFAMVAILDIPANSIVHFSDNEWNGQPIGSGGAFSSLSEGELSWNSGISILAAGTVLTFNGLSNISNTDYGVSHGSIIGTINLNAQDEVLYAFSGVDSATPTNFIAAIATGGFNMANGTLDNTGLVADSTAVEFISQADVFIYSRSTICDSTHAACLAEINKPSNWNSDDGMGNQAYDGNFPDFPSDVPDFFSGTALPLELLSFSAHLNHANHVVLKWSFSYSFPDSRYYIEQSRNGWDWSEIHELELLQNQSEEENHELGLEENLEGLLYFRFVKEKHDQQKEILQTISLSTLAGQSVLIYPNPFQHELIVQGSRSNLTIQSSLGQIIPFKRELNERYRTLHLEHLKKGMYFLQVDGKQYKIVKE